MTALAALEVGKRYVGTVTGVLDGERIYSEQGFTAARATIEPFIRDREATPDQDRVFAVRHPRHPESASPRLFVAGSIRPA